MFHTGFFMKYGIVLIINLGLMTGHASAQLIDKLKEDFSKKPKFSLRLDTRNSFIKNKAAKIRGIKFGLDYGKDITVGLSINWLDKKFDEVKPVLLVNDDTAFAKLDFGYLGLFFEYTFLRNKRWEVDIPIQIGIGSTYFTYNDHKNEAQRLSQKPIVVYEPSMTATYKFWRYFGVGVGVGYRLMLINNKDIEGNFNSPTYTLRLKVFFGDIYKDIFKKEH